MQYMHAEVYSSRVPELYAVFTQRVMTARESGVVVVGGIREKRERADMLEKERK